MPQLAKDGDFGLHDTYDTTIQFREETEPVGDVERTSGDHDEPTPTLLTKVKDLAEEKAPTIMEAAKSAARKVHLDSVNAASVSRLFHPTTAHVRYRVRDEQWAADQSDEELALLWRARDQRKGRGSMAVPVPPPLGTPGRRRKVQSFSHAKQISRNIARMFTTFPYWDMAFWSGWSYSIGSALFVIDGAFSWGPLAFPSTEFAGESKYGVPLCFFFGALFYQLGAVVAYLEAVNAGSFHGSAMRRLLDGNEREEKEMLDEKLHEFFQHMVPHHSAEKADEEAADMRATAVQSRRAPRRGGVDLGEAEEGTSNEYLTWRWWPTWHALRTYHAYEIGYIACTIQLFGVTLYGMTAIVILPGILDSLNTWQTNAAYWIPQIVAAACFLTASIMFTLEVQVKWWKPEPGVLGWWIGVWSIIGSVGFEYVFF
ncbi:hypothetical protein B0A55_04705 [Friedmanniomyces simplex]|uniref:Integral membrane protein n=1 Tax=Friedmanniomyces simplex TaxID=329884 RepID=A0A4U0XJ05_9PEZI|nr:hypothetical protein B0A55_04705 [Friedmanniomyces simplex]